MSMAHRNTNALLTRRALRVIILSSRFVTYERIRSRINADRYRLITEEDQDPCVLTCLCAGLRTIVDTRGLRVQDRLRLIPNVTSLTITRVLNENGPTLLVRLAMIERVNLERSTRGLSILSRSATVRRRVTDRCQDTSGKSSIRFTNRVRRRRRHLL